MNNFADTIYFKEIFKTYDDFDIFLQIYTDTDQNDNYHKIVFNKLFNRYCNSNINYDTIDAFKRNFGLEYSNAYSQYKFRVKAAESEYSLTLDELSEIGQNVVNVAKNTNSELIDPLNNILQYVSTQRSSKTRQNKLASFVTAISLISDKFLFDFIYKFNKHFMQIFTTQQLYYKEISND